MNAKQKTVNVNVRVSPDLHKFLVAAADKELMTISTWIRRVLGNLQFLAKGAAVPPWRSGEPTSKKKHGKLSG